MSKSQSRVKSPNIVDFTVKKVPDTKTGKKPGLSWKKALYVFAIATLVVAGLNFPSSGKIEAATTSSPVTASNPSLGQSCGMNIVLILDSSSSMAASDISTLKTDATSLVNALMPATPSKIGVVNFNTNVVSSLNPTSNKTTVLNAINSVSHSGSIVYTNWDAALKAADPMVGAGDLVIIITDGNPNKYLNGTTVTPSGSGTNTTAAVNAAINSSNAIKSGGTRILAIGINSSGTGGGLNKTNLEAITGTQVKNFPTDTISNINQVDVALGNISSLNTVLTGLVTALCGGNLIITKQLDTGDATMVGGAGWHFTVNGVDYATNENGSITIPYTQNTTNISVSEVTQSDFPFESVSCTNGTQASGNAPTVSGISVTGQTITNCTFINHNDACTNLPGYQSTVPDGYQMLTPGQCTLLPDKCQYNPGILATDPNCVAPPELCTDETANNVGQPLPCTYTMCQYNDSIRATDPNCVAPPELCTDETANNVGQPLPCTYTMCQYNDSIRATDPNCVAPPELCTDETANNVGQPLPCTYTGGSCPEGQVMGEDGCYSTASADLSVSKTIGEENATTTTANVGDSVTFTITVTNNGPDGATGVSVNDPIPSGLTVTATSTNQGIYDGTTWNIGDLSNGSSATLKVTGTVNSSFTNTATVSGQTTDPNSDNNTGVAVVNVNSGGSGTYSLNVTISNNQGDGSGTVTSTSTPDQSSQINCSVNSDTGTCNATFASGTVVTLTAVAAQGSTFTGTWSGDCTGDNPVCTITVNANKTVNAHFALASNNTGCTSNCGSAGPSTTTTGGGSSSVGGVVSIPSFNQSQSQGQVLGASTVTGLQMPVPEGQVLGESTALPRTGTPLAEVLVIFLLSACGSSLYMFRRKEAK